jgi:hypothetical protein
VAESAADAAEVGSSTLGATMAGAEADGAPEPAGFGLSQAARRIARLAVITVESMALWNMARCYTTGRGWGAVPQRDRRLARGAPDKHNWRFA